MKILDTYKKYRIMPQLVEHQLRVAGVADAICEHITLAPALSQREREEIVAACLLHDMGNILKFDLTKTQSLLNREMDIPFWQKVKEEYLKKYGEDEHIATIKICKELNVSDRVIELVDNVGFEVAIPIAGGQDFGKKICEYADARVSPAGVASMRQRHLDLRVRYAHKVQDWGAGERRDAFENALQQIERQIFEHCKIKPEDITEDSTSSIKEKLKSFEI